MYAVYTRKFPVLRSEGGMFIIPNAVSYLIRIWGFHELRSWSVHASVTECNDESKLINLYVIHIVSKICQ